jgi:hypothetical protein
LQATVPFEQTRPAGPSAQTRQAPADPWAAQTGTPQRMGGGATVSFPPPPPPARRSSGPGGCCLGLIALVIVITVAGGFAYTVAKPRLTDRVQRELSRGLATQVAAIDSPALLTPGEITLTEEQINREADANAASFAPVKNPHVTIQPDGLSISFELFGMTSTYRGGVEVSNGRIVVVDPELSGPATQVLNANDVADILEAQFASLMERSNVEPTSVRLRVGELTVTTKRA